MADAPSRKRGAAVDHEGPPENGFAVPRKRHEKELVKTDANFRAGQVMRLRMRNFVTYTDVSLYARPGLNLIVGPNGSGKSTVICALCLVLGGKPSVLGRGDQLKDFVKHNEQQATIDIDLFSGPGKAPHQITRMIWDNNTNRFQLNGRTVTQTEILALVKELHIRVDNFTTFLPQDKVSKFAEAQPPQLLRAMEEALGGGEFETMHDQLIDLGKQALAAQAAVGQVEKEVGDLERVNQQLETAVAAFQQREELLKRAQNLKKKVPWLQYRAAEGELQDLHNNYELARDAHQRAQAAMAPQERALKTARTARDKACTVAEEALAARRRLATESNRCASELAQKVRHCIICNKVINSRM